MKESFTVTPEIMYVTIFKLQQVQVRFGVKYWISNSKDFENYPKNLSQTIYAEIQFQHNWS